MIDFRQYKNLDDALLESISDKNTCKYLASLTIKSINELSIELIQNNYFKDNRLLQIGARELWKSTNLEEYLNHVVWCAHREAKWAISAQNKNSIALDYQFENVSNFVATAGRPCIIISPMTLGTHDAMHLISSAIKKFQPNRPFVFYGEKMDSFLKINPEYQDYFADSSSTGIKKIWHTLKQGGLFLTYPDFVYDNHHVISGDLFGLNRSYSSSFMKIILKSEAFLLPITSFRIQDKLNINFYSKVLPILNDSENKLLPIEYQLQLQVYLIGKLLEGLIQKVPDQWRLLPTLTHEAEEMG